jgi:SET domain-containing protein
LTIKNTYIADSEIHGKGLFAKSRISGGSVIGWLRGNPCSEDGCYVLWISETRGIEVTCHLRYINHSDRPNACYYDDLSVVALRDIEPGEEITHDYNSAEW